MPSVEIEEIEGLADFFTTRGRLEGLKLLVQLAEKAEEKGDAFATIIDLTHIGDPIHIPAQTYYSDDNFWVKNKISSSNIPPELQVLIASDHKSAMPPPKVTSAADFQARFSQIFTESLANLNRHADEASKAAKLFPVTPMSERLLSMLNAAPKLAVWNLGIIMMTHKELLVVTNEAAYNVIMCGCLMPHPKDRLTMDEVIRCLKKLLKEEKASKGGTPARRPKKTYFRHDR